MKKTGLESFYIAVILILIAFLYFITATQRARAETYPILGQLYYQNETQSISGGGCQNLGLNAVTSTTTISDFSFIVRLKSAATATSTYLSNISRNLSDKFSDSCGPSDTPVSGCGFSNGEYTEQWDNMAEFGSTTYKVNIHFVGTCKIDANYRYRLYLDVGTGDNYYFRGSSNAASYPLGNGQIRIGGGAYSEDSVLKDFYFQVNSDIGGILTATAPVNIATTSPINFVGTLSSNLNEWISVRINWTYYAADLSTTTGHFYRPLLIDGLGYNFNENVAVLGLNAAGNYSYNVQLWKYDTDIDKQLSMPTGEYYFSITGFNLGAFATSTIPAFTIEYRACSITDIGGCLINAVTYLFMPDLNSVFQKYNQLKTDLSLKIPFGYFTLISNSINGIAATNTPAAFAMADLSPLNDSVFNPIKGIMVIILWVVFGFSMLFRLKHLQL